MKLIIKKYKIQAEKLLKQDIGSLITLKIFIFQPSTINHQPSTINHQPSTINHQPSTKNN